MRLLLSKAPAETGVPAIHVLLYTLWEPRRPCRQGLEQQQRYRISPEVITGETGRGAVACKSGPGAPVIKLQKFHHGELESVRIFVYSELTCAFYSNSAFCSQSYEWASSVINSALRFSLCQDLATKNLIWKHCTSRIPMAN